MAVNLSFIGGAGWQFFDNNGLPLNGGKIYTYAAGTTTPLTTYTSWFGNVANSNPIILDSAGRTPEQIWATEGLLYKYVVADANNVVIRTWDNIGGSVVASDLANDLANTSNNAKGDALIGFKQSNASGFITGAVAKTVNDKLQEVFSVKDFGAVGDGVTNDTDAFAAAATAINAAGGGKLIIPPGTYIVGKQTFAGAVGKGYSYAAANILYFNACTKSVIVEGNGAILKIANGLKFGSFDPITGAIYIPGALPFTNSDYKANIGSVIAATSCTSPIEISNLEIDGNIQNISLGGQWGDTGYQCDAYGLFLYNNSQVTIKNVYTHHNGLDGIIVGYAGVTETTQAYPHTLINVRSEYNARQGLSWVGGNQLTAIGCKFNNTGKSTFFSAPAAGVDIEAESSICRNGLFLDCEIANNTGVGMIADTGDSADSTFLRCKIIGATNWSIWPKKPRFSFLDCLIVGSYVNVYQSTTKTEDATRFTRCFFTDENKYSANVYVTSGLLSNSNTQKNVTYQDCTFVSTQTKFGRFDEALLRNCKFNLYAGTNYISNQDWAAILWGATLENIIFNDFITVNPPADAYYIGLNGPASETYLGFNYAPEKIRWFNWNSVYGQLIITPPVFQSFIYGMAEQAVQTYGTAAPIAGTWTQGSRVTNIQPTVGQPKSWVCTVAGTPGTWVSEGNL